MTCPYCGTEAPSLALHACDVMKLQARINRLEHVLAELVGAVDSVFGDSSFQAVHEVAMVHGVRYTGPVISEELHDARLELQ